MTLITCSLMGGLGNQLFQIFTTISYAIQYGYTFKFINAKKLGGGATTVRSTYWDNFLSKLKQFTTSENLYMYMSIVREDSFRYEELDVNPYYNTLLIGYFQSYKYFESHFGMICRMIGLEITRSNVLKKLKYTSMADFNNCISLHFRLGDYKKIQNIHPILPKEYYEKAIQCVREKASTSETMKVLFFCEDADLADVMHTIDYLTTQFPTYQFIRGDASLEDWEQLMLMSCCHHNIIANSSFSWWAAHFNIWEDKVVCFPSLWFGRDAPHDTSDLCPDTWVKIECT